MAFSLSSMLRPKKVSPTVEAGVSGAHVYGGWIVDRETNRNLTYLTRNSKYEEIIANIAIIGAGVRYFTALGTTANWSIKANENDTTGEYHEIAEKIMCNLDHSWSSVVAQAINHRWFGFSVQEWTADRDKIDGTIFFRSIENRPQRTIEQFDMDENGQVIGFGQRAPITSEMLYVPRKKVVYLVDDTFSDSPAGLGILRHVYESCERLSNYLDLEKQGFERNLRNIPIGRVPYAELQKAVNNGEITDAQAKAAIASMESMVRIARKQSTTGLLLDSTPYYTKTDTGIAATANQQWGIDLLQGSPSDGQAEIDKAIERIQREIARVLGIEGVLLDGGGSNAMAKEKNESLYLNINSCLQTLKFQFNKDLIDPFWKLNGFPDEMKPTFEVEDVSQNSAAEIAAVLRDMATAGAPISPDDEVINDVREMLGVSQVDLEAAMERVMAEQEQAAQSHEAELASNDANILATEAKAKAMLKPKAK